MAGPKEDAYFNEAERLYKDGKTLEKIAALLPVSVTQLSKWSKKGDWAAKRRAALASPRTLAEKLRLNLERQIEDLEAEKRINPGAYDAIYKAFCTIEKMEKVHDLRVVAVQAMEAWTEWLKQQDISPGELQLIGGRIRAWFRSME